MKGQNPPQHCLDKAQNIERYLASPMIASIYALIAVFWAVLLSGLFASLVYFSSVNPTAISITILAVLALIPSAFGIVAYFLRPKDPVSLWISRLAETLRTPLNVLSEICTFKTVLMNGATLSIQVVFYFAASPKDASLREQIYTFSHAALSTLCSMRFAAPAKRDFEAALEPALAIIASEWKLPVLYSNVLGVYVTADSYTYSDEDLLAAAG